MQASPYTWFGLVLGVGVVTALEKQSTFGVNIASPELKYDPSSLKKWDIQPYSEPNRGKGYNPKSMGAKRKSLS